MKNEIVVIGGNHHNTLSILRSLGFKDISCNLILTTKVAEPFVSKSKYIKSLHLINIHEDIVKCLIDNYSTYSLKPIVIVCHDIASSIIDLNYNLLSKYFILPGCNEQGKITYLMNKDEMANLAISVGLSVPKQIEISDISDSDFPCIIKPICSRNGSKNDIRVFENRDTLNQFVRTHNDTTFQIQQFINSEFEFQLIGCSLNSGEEIIMPGYTRILRPAKATNTAFLKYCKLDDSFDIEICKKYIRATGYSGLFSMEFLRGKDGVDYFMEINFRNDGNAISVTAAGVNLPYVWYLFNSGQPYFDELKKSIKEVYVMPEFQELALLSSGQISLKHFVSDVKKTDCFMDYSSDDPQPTNGMKTFNKQCSIAIVKNIIRRLCKH